MVLPRGPIINIKILSKDTVMYILYIMKLTFAENTFFSRYSNYLQGKKKTEVQL